MSLTVIASRGAAFNAPPQTQGLLSPLGHWQSATYISYNLIMSVPVLASLGTTLRSRREGWP